MKKILSMIMTAAMVTGIVTSVPAVSAKETDVSPSSDNSFTISQNAGDFSWDNASVYFLLTDRFNNGNTSNDHSYDRGLEKDGTVTTKMRSNAGSFQGGDFAGITQKIEEGYFDALGVNALWISAPYEQIQGYSCAGNGKSSFPHYAYHGYYAGDYSQFDDNFGTPQEFKTMVDTAHSHGLRVVLDVVMNHPGYNTMYDMNKFGFGQLNADWENEYYTFSGNNNTYHNYIQYTGGADNWLNWWGKGWLRAGLTGYDNFGSGDILGSAGGELPDFKTENTEEVPIPTFLENKWKSEGVYDTEVAAMDNWFAENNKEKTVRNYLCYWLSSYVENYGVDGFRCDTAKHVEKESWASLKDTCTKALENWRKNNPGTPGSDWDEDFWMTGEIYGKGLSSANDDYFTQGKFDSTINFEFTGGNGIPKTGGVNTTYEKYAKNINTSDNYNVLTYISSHDTKLCGRDSKTATHNTDTLIYQGSALQLLPGGVQIFYGDETGREYVKEKISSVQSIVASGNHDVRSFMNWDTIDNQVLTHWQKVGSFRNNHISVGAGSHTSLTSTSGAAFERYYDKNNIKDKVVCCIGANANTDVTINVNSADFPDGTILRNTYDNTEKMVYHGKVTFNSGANGTILCEVRGTGTPVKAESVTLSQKELSLTIGATADITAEVSPENAIDKTVVWTSSDNEVATVENGKITAVKPGNTKITATADGVSAVCDVTVEKIAVTSVKLSRSTAAVYPQKTFTLTAAVTPDNATYPEVVWSSSNTAVATVADGKVTALKPGTAKITAEADGVKAVCNLTVKRYVSSVKLNAARKTLYRGGTYQLRAMVSPTNASNKALSWTSSNRKVATVSSTGKVTARSKGTAVITAKAKDGSGKYSRCVITVKQRVTKIKLSKTVVKLKKKNSKANVKAYAYPSNANVKTMKVRINNSKIAGINRSKINSGGFVTVTAKKKGTAKIYFTATDGSRKSAACTVKVLK